MIKFESISSKQFSVSKDGNVFLNLNINPSTISNKFHIISNYIEGISKQFEDFDEWFCTFINDYSSSTERYSVLERNLQALKDYSDNYLNFLGIDFSSYVDVSKAKKGTILFSAIEIEKILRASSYLKMYSIISCNDSFKLDQRLHRMIYNELVSGIDEELLFKIFSVIKTKTFKYNLSDRYMWDYIKMIQCKTIDIHVVEIFNFIMNNILILCEPDKNPITYFVTVVDESVKWFLRSVYKASVVYDDSISTEDIQSTSFDNLKTYAYNDTLGRLKGIAYKQMHENFEKPSLMTFDFKKEEEFDNFILSLQRRIEGVSYVSPFCEFLLYPILAKLTDIPYRHFKTLSAEHSIVLAVYVQNLLKKVFDSDYKTLFSMLSFYPKTQPSLLTTYKLKNVQYFIRTAHKVNNFLGFKAIVLLNDMLGNFVGKISRVDFVNIFDGRDLSGIPVSKIETEMIDFFTSFFSGKLEDKFEVMKMLMQSDFS
jgi:hypothetical protein